MSYPLIDFGGAGPLIHLAVANGFPPQTYTPLLRLLIGSYRAVCLPPRALWPGETPPAQYHDWHMMADDLLAGLRQHDLRDVIAIGHSFGGVASALAVLAEPSRFRALCLLDPTILPPEYMAGMAAMQADGSVREFPLVQGALRRRARFESAQAAWDYYRAKSLFGGWPDETLWLYVQHGTRPLPDGSGVELAWTPEWEAYYFSTLYTRTWDDAPRLRGLLPLLVVRGSDSDTFWPDSAQRLRALLPEMTYAEISGHGHLFPHTAPQQTSRLIADWLASLP